MKPFVILMESYHPTATSVHMAATTEYVYLLRQQLLQPQLQRKLTDLPAPQAQNVIPDIALEATAVLQAVHPAQKPVLMELL